MLTAFGFGEDRQLSLDLLKTMIDEHRARRDRVRVVCRQCYDMRTV